HDWDADGNNSIHQAARAGNLERIKQLVTFGINPKTRNIIGDTALRFATENNHMDIVKYLIEVIGLDVNNANQDGTTALIVATFNNNPGMIQYLAHMGANVNQTASASVVRTIGDTEQEFVISGWTALMAAAQLGYNESIEMLLDSGANLDATDSDNWNALLFAVQNGYTETAQLLIDRGINYNIESMDNHTALSLAILNDDNEMIALLENVNAAESSVPIISYEESYTETTVDIEGDNEYYYDEYYDD
ncbi:MAG: ankyrin repeat domain-containing protein, partial [Brevinema sp.]